LAGDPLNVTAAPASKPVPRIVTEVAPAEDPRDGAIDVTVNAVPGVGAVG
jgi:hypothetical protein